MKKYGVLAIIIIAIIIINLLTNSVVLLTNSEEDTIEIYITGTQNYDYAYEMLELINKERKNWIKYIKNGRKPSYIINGKSSRNRFIFISYKTKWKPIY